MWYARDYSRFKVPYSLFSSVSDTLHIRFSIRTPRSSLPFSPFSPQLMRFPTSAAIRIFGIFTHAQICHGGFWDCLSRQLQQRGPNYIERCTFRSEPLSAGNNVISPATFPSLPYLVEDLPPAAPLVKVSEEDMKDVSEIDIVSKTVAKYMCTDPFHACVPPSRHHRSSHNSYIV